ncbi:hypothetical protein BKA15_003584 [Microlunatus parietis]|uniref:DUF3566 domain-containing protein n=1 Tax=Microlunatus parietis TaxID=682979 RepID=A0A7Y9LD05_9ACTN|nr:hypothetical protein [Microlunatus parietis]
MNGNGSYGRNGSGQAGRPGAPRQGGPQPSSAQSPQPRPVPGRQPAPQPGASKESLRNKLGLGQKAQPGAGAPRPSAGSPSSGGAPTQRPPVARPGAAGAAGAGAAAGTRQPGTPVARANQPGVTRPGQQGARPQPSPAARTGQPEPSRPGVPRPDTARTGTTSPVSAPRTEMLNVGSPTRTVGTAASAGSPTERSRAELGLPPKAGQARRTRKARLRLSRLDPWSVMKTSFLFSISAGIVLVVAVYAIWTVLQGSGLFESVNLMIGSVTDAPNDTTPFRIEEYVNTPKVMGVAALIACVDVVILTALATLGSFLYNLAATMLGGLEVTLAED